MNIVLIRKDLPLLNARISKLEALGGIFFTVDSKFSARIELFSNEIFQSPYILRLLKIPGNVALP